MSEHKAHSLLPKEDITRQKRRWFKHEQQPSQQHLTPFDQNHQGDDSKLCLRCRSLRLKEHVEQPWAVWDAEADGGFREALIDPRSINADCSLCTEFGALLEAAGMSDSPVAQGQHGSLKLVCRRAVSNSWAMFDFSITHTGSGREWLMFLTQPLSAFRYVNGDLTLTDTDSAFHREDAYQASNTHSINFKSISGWIASCQSYHGTSCGSSARFGRGFTMLIDCSERQLCKEVDKPYVCLSYVWGANDTAHKTSSGLLPEILPQTVSDAITVTLRVGFRFLWCDRYCIPQDDAEAKHDAI
jgi:hypothetical protein